MLHVFPSLRKTARLWIGILGQLEDPQLSKANACHQVIMSVQMNHAEQDCSIVRICTLEAGWESLLIQISVYCSCPETVCEARVGAVSRANQR